MRANLPPKHYHVRLVLQQLLAGGFRDDPLPARRLHRAHLRTRLSPRISLCLSWSSFSLFSLLLDFAKIDWPVFFKGLLRGQCYYDWCTSIVSSNGHRCVMEHGIDEC